MTVRDIVMAAAGNSGSNDPYFSNVSLLLHGDGTNGAQNNTFLDSSANNFTITRNGNVTQGTFSPFALNGQAWSAATHGGSAYFDGSGDYLRVASGYGLGSGSFTIEMFAYLTSLPNSQNALYAHGTSDGASKCILYVGSDQKLAFYNSTGIATSTINVPLNAWCHIAVVRNGSSLALYINGVQSGTGTTTNNISDTVVSVMQGFGGITNSPIGFASNVRVLVGTALYTGNFTPPTAPLTAVANTSLLLNFTNAGIYDQAGKCVLETVGNAQVSTTQKKFGTGAMYFDGNGDVIKAPYNPAFQFGTGDFTIEAFIYISGTSANPRVIVSNYRYGQTTSFLFHILSNGKLELYKEGTSGTGGGALTSTTVIPTDTFVHVAAARTGGILRLFVNGVKDVEAADTLDYKDIGEALGIGAPSSNGNGIYGDYWNGYIDELRITKGYARYTANFTPPTAPFADK